jgi:hypothetical protein
MTDHECARRSGCDCDLARDEPKETCQVHGAGEWPPRCEACGRLMPWPELTEKGK